MKNSDIIGIIENAIISKIGKEWKHDVVIQETTINKTIFDIDGKRYELSLQPVYMKCEKE